MRLGAHHEFEDFTSVMALYADYCTAEPFIQAQYDIRIQKIGEHLRFQFSHFFINTLFISNS